MAMSVNVEGKKKKCQQICTGGWFIDFATVLLIHNYETQRKRHKKP